MTVTIYTQTSCTSSKKALQWLRDNDISYKEKRITSEPLTLSEFKRILSMTEDGTAGAVLFLSKEMKSKQSVE